MAGDASVAARIARGRAAGQGVDLVVAAVIGPGSNIEADVAATGHVRPAAAACGSAAGVEPSMMPATAGQSSRRRASIRSSSTCGSTESSASAPADAQRTSAKWVSVSTGTPVAEDSASKVGIGSTSQRVLGASRELPVLRRDGHAAIVVGTLPGWTTPRSPTAWTRSRRCSSWRRRTRTRPGVPAGGGADPGDGRAGGQARARRAGEGAARDRPRDRGAAARALETGEIAELAELERELSPGLVGLGRYLGLGAKRSVEIARALGSTRRRSCARRRPPGRLRRCPAWGRSRGADPRGARAGGRAAAAARDPPAPCRASSWRDRGGARRRAGGRPAPLARLVRAARRGRRRVRPGAAARAVRRVAADRRRDRAWRAARARRDGRGRPRRAASWPRRTPPAPSSCARPARALRRRARPVARRGDRGGGLRALGVPWCPPELREAPFRASRRRCSSSPTSAATCTATRPGRTAARASWRWAAPPARAATTTSRSATTRPRSAPCRA